MAPRIASNWQDVSRVGQEKIRMSVDSALSSLVVSAIPRETPASGIVASDRETSGNGAQGGFFRVLSS